MFYLKGLEMLENAIKKNNIFSKKNLIALIIPLIIEQLLAVSVGMADSLMARGK